MLWLSLTGLIAMTSPAAAQSLRGTATSTGQYVQIRPLVRDTIPLSAATPGPNGEYTYQGVPIVCVAGQPICIRYEAGRVEHAVLAAEDVSFTAWGLGLTGLSATVLVRARTDAGSDFTWPRADHAFDAMLAYLELDRSTWRVRVGRQRSTSGLGFAGFDGASVMGEPLRHVQIEAYGGRSLARGLDEPRNAALQNVEDFVLDRSAWLLGGAAWIEPLPGINLTARYQREIWSDRSGLLSERASLDLRAPLPRRMSLTASSDYDVAFNRVGTSDVTVRAPLGRNGSFWLEATGRRYVPYFELWTIWGFFDPAAYHEGELRASWSPSRTLSLRANGGYRKYQPTNAPIVISELPDHAQRGGVGARWSPRAAWTLDGQYDIEKGFGAFLSSGRAFARWQANEHLTVTLNGTAFQQIEEFRVGEGAVLGGGASLGYDLNTRTGIDVGGNIYHQTFTGRVGTPDWNQLRGFASLRIGFGSDPGARLGGR